MSSSDINPDQLAGWVRDARARTLEIFDDLTDEQLRVPQLEILNPFLWEIGHIAWFQEHWVLRHAAGADPLLATGDALYDSSAVHHDTRWDLALPTREQTLDYVHAVRDRVLSRLGEAELGQPEAYFNQLSVFHEDMHDEAFLYMRQTLGYPMPRLTGCSVDPGRAATTDLADGDAEVPGGTLELGGSRDAPFVFDNEQWAHAVEIEPFAIARTPVTQGQFAEFADDGGYQRRELWSDEGWRWRDGAGAEHPIRFVRDGRGWQRRHYDRPRPLELNRPVVHVNAYEAEAYCRWAGRRLPTEAEWEAAAACEPSDGGDRLGSRKRRYPWGDRAPDPTLANLDARVGDTVDVGALPEGDSAFGCRQMLGNVWEWTSSVFGPYPGFEPGPYKEYSQPWFGTRWVLRGGAWATRSRMVTNTYRNFYPPNRCDVFAGFRTCRLG